MCDGANPAAPTLAQVFLRYCTTTAFSLLPEAFRLPIVVSWHTTKTTSASVPARSATVAVRARDRRARTPDQLHRRGASGDPARGRQPQPAGGDREGRRPVQCAGPGRCGGADAQGPERVEPGRERCAHAGAAGGGEGSRREAQPAARSRARTAVRQRQGGGRASALPRTRRRDPRRREGTGLFGRARRGGRPRLSSNGAARIATSSASSSRPRTGWSCPTRARPPAI